MTRQFLTFAGMGAIGTTGHYATLILLASAGLDPVAASTFGAAVGASINYLLNHRFTFRSTLPHRRSAPRFAVVALSSLLLNTALMAVAVDWLRWPYLPAQILTTSLVLASNFAFSRLWAFRHGTAGES